MQNYKPDLRISAVTPIQVVENVDINTDGRIDLVLGKPMVVRVKVQIDNPQGVPPDQLITTRLLFQGAQKDESRTLQQLADNNFIVDFFLTPSDLGDSTVIARVDPSNAIAESDENNNERTVSVDVKQVRDIRYAYRKVDYLGTTPDFATTVANSADYLKAVYPVAPNRFVNQQFDFPYIPSAASLIPRFGAVEDATHLWLESKLLTAFRADRVVGIVPKQWFSYHRLGDNTEGVVFPLVGEVAFVLDGRPLVTAHELGHTYGFGEGYRLNTDGTCCLFDGDPTTGYWVQRQKEVKNSIDYMGDSPGAVPYPGQAALRWSTRDRFADLFRQFRTQPNDPEVLLLTGTINQNGTATISQTYRSLV